MQIQINTDNNVEGHEQLAEKVKNEINKKLDRFSNYLTRIEVHLGDENSQKSGQYDKRCLLEARLKHHQPIVVSDNASTVMQATTGAVKKLKHALKNTIGRLSDI
ncbi:HPF/RaiA family ribosome-associated protein [Legionella israelensis]|uniref:HPF/RaiA family ribosome-associated protein n=1 Tax=Legionella israelensis TaxID=454 RepID=A0A0W0VMS2_9GAMM|nr:HPF/RaiA family ribosome-associated protein [Legionella israelensis]KTD21442.1 hypothetical protein Lisr_1551 [Legionella israelensis]QBR84181.1 HPF/RaiA family ribosome-associated protein [Legionella israelensis]QBS08441.1 HPF/RaiA family ribosome-associated protein [Legionella israelensis]QDP72715.1 HPF/RaiA family ribosome-associated protein [Legionella israelensis]SCY15589.1 Sigma 54 modulation protein / S30EA ribosomal protein [Legionella israelensis DSM 19235]